MTLRFGRGRNRIASQFIQIIFDVGVSIRRDGSPVIGISGHNPGGIDLRTDRQRIEDLEHDNNVMRMMIADLQRENLRMAQEWEAVQPRIAKLIDRVDEFVGRFGVIQ